MTQSHDGALAPEPGNVTPGDDAAEKTRLEVAQLRAAVEQGLRPFWSTAAFWASVASAIVAAVALMVNVALDHFSARARQEGRELELKIANLELDKTKKEQELAGVEERIASLGAEVEALGAEKRALSTEIEGLTGRLSETQESLTNSLVDLAEVRRDSVCVLGRRMFSDLSWMGYMLAEEASLRTRPGWLQRYANEKLPNVVQHFGEDVLRVDIDDDLWGGAWTSRARDPELVPNDLLVLSILKSLAQRYLTMATQGQDLGNAIVGNWPRPPDLTTDFLLDFAVEGLPASLDPAKELATRITAYRGDHPEPSGGLWVLLEPTLNFSYLDVTSYDEMEIGEEDAIAIIGELVSVTRAHESASAYVADMEAAILSDCP